MQERDIVNDLLVGTKASINSYTTAIQECSNQQLRSTLQTLRDEAEQMQYQLFQMAEQKGYYTPAPAASTNDINSIKTALSSAVNSANSKSNNLSS
ncbi:MAG: spore coat protein [Tissierellaceae bacterium]